MTDKEFKRLSRSQLIDIIYQFQVKQDELMEENERLSRALEDKRIRISETGNLAEAAMEIHKVMEAAQNAAAHYIEEMQLRVDDECQRILGKQREKLTAAEEEAAAILRQARREAAAIVARAHSEAEGIIGKAPKAPAAPVVEPREEKAEEDPLEAILKEYRYGR